MKLSKFTKEAIASVVGIFVLATALAMGDGLHAFVRMAIAGFWAIMTVRLLDRIAHLERVLMAVYDYLEATGKIKRDDGGSTGK